MFNVKRNKEIEYGPTRKDLNIILENKISEKKKEIKEIKKDLKKSIKIYKKN
jgi:hypothetical protein